MEMVIPFHEPLSARHSPNYGRRAIRVHGNGHDHFHELNIRTTDQLGECWGVHGNGHDHFHELLTLAQLISWANVGEMEMVWPFPSHEPSPNYARAISWASVEEMEMVIPFHEPLLSMWSTLAQLGECNEEFMEMVMTISMNPTFAQRDQLGECRGVHGNGHDHFHELLTLAQLISWASVGEMEMVIPFHEPLLHVIVRRVLRRWKWSYHFMNPYCTW